jgi:hypothetical protein
MKDGLVSVRRRAACVAACLLLVSSGSARAQGGLAGGGYFFDVKRFSGEPGTSVLDAGGHGFWLSAGTGLGERWTIRAELGVAGETTTTRSVEITTASAPLTVGTTYTSQFTTVSMLAGVGGPGEGQRFGLTWLGGVTFARARRTTLIETGGSLAGSLPSPEPSVTVDYVAGPMVGVDAGFRVSPTLLVTAGVRAAALRLSADLSGFTIRPSVGLLYRF